MSITGFTYNILEQTRELNELGRLFMIERLLVDADTDSQNVTPTLVFEDSTSALTAVSTSTRDVTELVVNRMGPLHEVRFAGSFSTQNIQIHNLELVIRPVFLGINILPGGQNGPTRVIAHGYTNDPSTVLFFDINAFQLPADARRAKTIIKRLYIEAETNAQTITPTMVYDGTSTALAATTFSGRQVIEFSIGRTDRLRRIQLAGDFTNSDIILYDIELDMYSAVAGGG